MPDTPQRPDTSNEPEGPHAPIGPTAPQADPAPADLADEAPGATDDDATRALPAILPGDLADDRLELAADHTDAQVAAPNAPDAPAPADPLTAPVAPATPPTDDAPDHAEPADAAPDQRAPAAEPQPAAATSDEPPRVAVVQLSGAEDGKVTPVLGLPIIIGRIANDVTVALPRDQWASRRHAQITYQDGAWRLEDLNSSNGTTIGSDRRPVRRPTALRVGEVFRVGHTDLMLTDDPAALVATAIAL